MTGLQITRQYEPLPKDEEDKALAGVFRPWAEAHLDLLFTCPECGQPITPDDFLRWLRGGAMCPGKGSTDVT